MSETGEIEIMEYDIDIKSTTERTYCVEAENEKHAQEKAFELMYKDEEVSDAWKECAEIASCANALIAAAPELYEQCKLFERAIVELMMQGETGGYEELEKLREILAKVDGGEG